MLVIYLFQRYLNKLEDFKFENIWKNKVLTHKRLLWYSAVFYYFVGIGVISSLILIGNENIFFGVIVTIFTMFIYGLFFARSILTFISLNNQRFMLLHSGYGNDPFDNSGFSKDNVVG